jgi:hypothetical protein
MGSSEAGAPLYSSSHTGQPAGNHLTNAPGQSSGARQGSHAPERQPHHGLQEGAGHFAIVRYRGFVLIPQGDLTWLIRPERSPMKVLPFRAPASSLSDVKALIDWRLAHP